MIAEDKRQPGIHPQKIASIEAYQKQVELKMNMNKCEYFVEVTNNCCIMLYGTEMWDLNAENRVQIEDIPNVMDMERNSGRHT